jgi:hypothetical protein
MIGKSQTSYYITYAIVSFLVIIAYVKVKSTEGLVITTKDFKKFQSNVLNVYSITILCEFMTVASFFHSFIFLKQSLDKIIILFVTSTVTSALFGILSETFDVGGRKYKYALSIFLYFLSMTTILIGTSLDHYIIGRVCYGAASALHHTSFESYLLHEHASRGFPDDWLSHTFSSITHTMTFLAAFSGILGQSTSYHNPLGCILLCAFLFIAALIYLLCFWSNDRTTTKLTISGVLFNMSQIYHATKSNKQVLFIILLSSLCESGITIFTFLWAPWLASFIDDSSQALTIPFEIIFASFITASMLGNYLYQLSSTCIGVERLALFLLLILGIAFGIGSLPQSCNSAYAIAIIIHFFVGGYWPVVGYLRGRIVSPELRSTSLIMSR